MSEIQVRQEHPDDLQAIGVVHLSAFEGDNEAGLVDELRTSSSYIPELSLVAEFNGRIVGHVLLTKVKVLRGKDNENAEVLAMAAMAVVPSQSHRGIGTVLTEMAVKKAKTLGHKGIIVVGHPDFYQRFGFSKISKWSLDTSLSISSDLVTGIELEEGIFEGGGNVIYPSLFDKAY